MTDTPAPEQLAEPVLRVVRGNPDATELGALVAVLVAAASSAPEAPTPVGAAWAAHDRMLRHGLPAGGWRRSSSPR